jgi:hypothetical protein
MTSTPPTEATSTPPTEALERIDSWRQRLAAQTVVSASEVQGHLFDLYGDLDARPELERIKPWLSLTVQREVFSAAELQSFLSELESELGPEVDAG